MFKILCNHQEILSNTGSIYRMLSSLHGLEQVDGVFSSMLLPGLLRFPVVCSVQKFRDLERERERDARETGRVCFGSLLESLILAPFLHRKLCIACPSSKDWQSGLLATVGKEFLRDWGGLKTRVHSV